MAYQHVHVELIRDGQCTPWGFRLTGGADIKAPLVIQKVSLGTPAEGELQKGDILMRVRDSEAKSLSHQAATDLISKAGNHLKLTVARCAGAIAPVSGILSPLGTPTTLYHLKSGEVNSLPLRPLLTPTDGNQYLFKPLPTTQFPQTPHRRMSTESYASTTSSETEKEAIVNQPYRTVPLITPSVKLSKDLAVGSYLRHEHSNSTSSPTSRGHRISDAYMLTKVQEAVMEAAQHSPGRTPTPDMGYPSYPNGPQISHKQYNSPLYMYSNQAIVDAVMAQAANAQNPRMNDVGVRDPSKTPLNITTSPTYQLIHDEEWRKGKVQEHDALLERVHNVVPLDEQSGYRCQSDIHQSDSFKTLMNALHGIKDF